MGTQLTHDFRQSYRVCARPRPQRGDPGGSEQVAQRRHAPVQGQQRPDRPQEVVLYPAAAWRNGADPALEGPVNPGRPWYFESQRRQHGLRLIQPEACLKIVAVAVSKLREAHQYLGPLHGLVGHGVEAGQQLPELAVGVRYLPLGLRDAIAMATIGLVVGDLSRWGIERPVLGPNRMIEEFGRIPLLDIGTIAMVKRGKIRVLPAVEEILFDGVRFADGAERPFGAIIFATGYGPGLDRVIEGFEAIADARGRPDRFGEESGIPGLYFVGFKNPPTGALREIALEAPRVARAIRAAAGG